MIVIQSYISFALALMLAYGATFVAIRAAAAFDFYDRPAGYKGHAGATPYLGGAAVVVAVVLVVAGLETDLGRSGPLIGGLLVLWAVGTLDDRRGLSASTRVVVEIAVGLGIWAAGQGWSTGLGSVPDALLTAVWIVGVVNAFNLFDNMDGAASSMAAVAAGAVAVWAAVEGDVWLAVTAAALSGACCGFLPHNLANPARIFLGDGGSMPIGFGVAYVVMAVGFTTGGQWQALALGLLLVGVPLLDTAMVVISRRRRGISILTAGRDHLTHRTRSWLSTASAVALVLGGAQAMLSAFSLLATRGGSTTVVVAVAVYIVLAGTMIFLLERRWRAIETAHTPAVALDAAVPILGRIDVRIDGRSAVGGLLGLTVGASSFAGGFYDSSIWTVAGLVLAVLLLGLAVARPLRLGRVAAIAVSAPAALAAWSLLSTLWSPSPEQAFVNGNRFLLLGLFFALAVLLIRDTRTARWAIGGAVVGTLAVAAWTVGGLLLGTGESLFLAGRINGPLGYVNGQGTAYALAIFPCLALAERCRRPLVAGGAMSSMIVLASLAVLTQSRGVALSASVGIVAAVVLVPGRWRRLAALAVAGVAVMAAGPFLLHVYSSAGQPGGPDVGSATIALICAALVGGLAWGAAVKFEAGLSDLSAARAKRLWSRATLVAAGCGIAAALVVSPSIERVASTQYHAFVDVAGTPPTTGTASSRLFSGSGQRYDYWRIAAHTWRADPLWGAGSGSFAISYFRERATQDNVQQPHSLALQTLAELGLVGFGLLALVLAAVFWSTVKVGRDAARTGSATGIGLAVAASGCFATWLAEADVDWITLLTGVTGVALLMGGAMVGLADAAVQRQATAMATRARAASGRRRGSAVIALGLLLALLAVVSLSRQTIAERYRSQAQAAVVDDPAHAAALARRSLRVDAAAVPSYYIQAGALNRLGDLRGARRALETALSKEPENAVTWTSLGAQRAAMGDLPGAEAAYARAHELNPRDAIIGQLVGNPTLSPQSLLPRAPG